MTTAFPSGALSAREADDIAREAYHFLYPLVLMDLTRRVMSNVPPGMKPGMGPENTFHHMRAYPPAGFHEVVRPNFDTLYSIAWLNLTREPLIISAPDTEGRYYLLPALDMWSDVFASPGKRTSGTGPGHFALVPRGWTGQLPAGVQQVDAPTPYVWVIGRTQTNGPADYAAVAQVQDGFKVTPLSCWGGQVPAPAYTPDPSVDMKTPPMIQVDTMPAAKYFAYGAELMKVNPPHTTDWSQVARLKRIGLEPGQSFEFQAAPAVVQAAMERATTDGLALMKAKLPTLARVVNGWQMNTDTMGVFGNYYLKRAIIAMVGLGANQPEDAVYPMCVGDAEGRPLLGSNRYVLHFSKAELPPVEAFWSLTMYDHQGFHRANRLDRFAIGDRDPLRYNPDGSLDLYMQADSPGAEKEANWLPSPAEGELAVTLRLYAPKAEALDGRWNPPAVQLVAT